MLIYANPQLRDVSINLLGLDAPARDEYILTPGLVAGRPPLQSPLVKLNDEELAFLPGSDLPPLQGRRVTGGPIALPALSYGCKLLHMTFE